MKKIAFLFLLSTHLVAQQLPVFNAKALYFLTDGDLSPRSLSTNSITPEIKKNDYLTVLNLPVSTVLSRSLQSVVVANSMLNNNQNYVVAKKNKLIYIIESYGEVKGSGFSIEEGHKKGQFVTVISYSNPQNPTPSFKFQVGFTPTSISLSPSEEYLAVSCEEYGNEVMIFELDDLGKPIRKIKKPASFPEGKIVDLKWHPEQDFLIYTNETARQVGLIKVLRDGPTNKIIRLQMHGNAVSVGTQPGIGRFVANNKFYLITDVKKKKTETSSNEKAEMYLVKFNYEETGTHFLLSKIDIGENFESIAFNGDYVATLNLNRSYMLNETTVEHSKPTVQLIYVKEDGSFQKLSQLAINGIYCSGLTFDSSGENLAYAVVEYDNLGIPIGGIEFIKIDKSNRFSMQNQTGKIIVPAGIHTLIRID